LEILFLGFRGFFSVFDLLKVSFLFRQALNFVSSLSFLERRRALWVFPDYFFFKKYTKQINVLNYVVTHWVAGFLTNFKHVASRHFCLRDFFYPLAFFSFSSNSFWVREAFKVKVPTVALSSSFSLVGSGVLYFIPANLRYYSTLFFFFRVFSASLFSVATIFSRVLFLKKPFLFRRLKLVIRKKGKLFSYLRWSNYFSLYSSLFFLSVVSSFRKLNKKIKRRKTKGKVFKSLKRRRFDHKKVSSFQKKDSGNFFKDIKNLGVFGKNVLRRRNKKK
jgi:hypothetical protein